MKGTVKHQWLKKAIIGMIGRPRVREFEQASRDVKGTQEALIRKVVTDCRDTAFGKDHGFASIRSVDDYRKAVPIRDFEGHRKYIERMTHGEADILFPGRPIFYNTTSGTSNKPKEIPVSPEYFSKAYTKVSRLWLYSCLRDNPKLFSGKNLSAVGAAEEGQVADGTPCGALSGAVYRHIPGVLKDVYSAPYPIFCIKDYDKKYYAMLRFAIGANITYIICPNPSSLLRFHETVRSHFEELVRDVRDGTLRSDVLAAVPEEGRPIVCGGLAPDPDRAKELEALYRQHGDGLRPRHYWPNLVCINTWKQGNCAQMIPRLEGFFPAGTAIREFGYQASEGRAGIVLGNDWDYSALVANVYHFEFVGEAEYDSKQPRTLLAHELEKGKRYNIFITNTSGLYRYNINDIIEVTGHYNQIPLFRFIRKGDGFTSLTGEKLTETQVLEAMDRARAEQNLPVPHFTLCCDEAKLCYKLFIEFPAATPADRRTGFTDAFDRLLKGINPEYEAKRGSKRLAAPTVHELPENSYELIKEVLVSRGMAREGQYKVVYLQRKPQVLAILDELAAKAGPTAR